MRILTKMNCSHSDNRLIFPFNASPTPLSSKHEQFARVLIILSEYYYTRCFLDRDEFMVENASLLIAFYDGREKGGTYYTFKKANCLGVPVVNIY